MRINGYFEEFSKLNQLITSVVKVWFNKGAREKIQPARPQQLLPMMMLLFKPIKSQKVINVTFNVFSFFLLPHGNVICSHAMILMSNQCNQRLINSIDE